MFESRRSSLMHFGTIALAAALAAGCGSSSSSSGSGSGSSSSNGSSSSSGSESARASSDIVDTAVAAGSFTTLVRAVQAAGLVDTLKGPGPFTVFAPTDQAFAALPAGTLDSLLRPENRARLQAILKYHVVSGAVRSGQVAGMTSAPTVEGHSVSISTSGGSVHVGDATVIHADVNCTNGVIHVIDHVLLPPS